jgi:hypothetical protein
MANSKVAWPTTNGNSLEFTEYPININFGVGQFGNYIFSKFNSSNNTWLAIYIGEGDLKDRIADHINKGCITKKGATHIFIRLNTDEKGRFDDETRLLVGNPEAYEPNGCNDKKGG